MVPSELGEFDETKSRICDLFTQSLVAANSAQHVEKMRFFVGQLRNAVITYPKCAYNSQFAKAIDQLNKEVSERLSKSKNSNPRRSIPPGVTTAFTPDASVSGIVKIGTAVNGR